MLDDAVATAARADRPARKKRPIDPERAATKFVKTAANPVTWKNGIYAGSLAIAVLLPVALLALAQGTVGCARTATPRPRARYAGG